MNIASINQSGATRGASGIAPATTESLTTDGYRPLHGRSLASAEAEPAEQPASFELGDNPQPPLTPESAEATREAEREPALELAVAIEPERSLTALMASAAVGSASAANAPLAPEQPGAAMLAGAFSATTAAQAVAATATAATAPPALLATQANNSATLASTATMAVVTAAPGSVSATIAAPVAPLAPSVTPAGAVPVTAAMTTAAASTITATPRSTAAALAATDGVSPTATLVAANSAPTATTARGLLSQRLGGDGLNALTHLDGSASAPRSADHPALLPPAPAAKPSWGPLSLPTQTAAMGNELQQSLAAQLKFQIEQKYRGAELRLDPPELGKIDLNVRLDGGRMQVHLLAAQPLVKEALAQQLDRLRFDLSQHFNGEVEISVSDRQPQQHSQRHNDDPAVASISGPNEADASPDRGATTAANRDLSLDLDERA
ncbi:flagellar hook-length control protein FliK [uncultured Ferrimonas sp.]|uniref:flagellar hook-length control protein FliK n=1 Tax=uncultured Ferrimonas sp. TaxID=432640 RepID=UPI002603BA23|nr:flagellar hook-length control protein FliK [uncultured Ferrimonas sp.]